MVELIGQTVNECCRAGIHRTSQKDETEVDARRGLPPTTAGGRGLTVGRVNPTRRFPMNKLAFVLVALAGLVVAATAAASPTTLHLTEKQTFQHYVDKGAKGESAGDIRTFGGTVLAAGKPVGHDRIRCVVGTTCSARVWLAGGSLISKAFVARGPNFTAKITGGTGTYEGARGTVTVVSGPVSHYTVKLGG
jgi:allene oxide cyclase